MDYDDKASQYLDGVMSVIKGHPQLTISNAELIARQLDLVKRLVSFAVDNSAFYRARFGGMPTRTAQDISRLPILTKADILEHHVKPLRASLQKGDSPMDIQTPLMTGKLAGAELWTTSGTTGMPTVVVRHPLEYDHAGSASATSLLAWLTPHDKVANLMTAGAGWGTSTMSKSSLNHAGIMTQLLGNKMPFDALAENFKIFNFNSIFGLPSWCAEFFTWLESSGNISSFPNINKLILGGESPSTYVHTDKGPMTLQEYVEYRWQGKIISLYGGTEIGTVGLPLTEAFRQENKFHVIDDTGYNELVDEVGDPLLLNNTGTLVTSRFVSALSPLIRFQTNDRCIFILDYAGDETGLRGFSFPKDGCRADDIIKLTSQNVYGFGEVLNTLIHEFDTNLQLIISKNKNVAAGQTIQINTEKKLPTEEETRLVERIRGELKRLLNGQGKNEYIDTINFIVQEGIQRGGTGKTRRVINMD